MANPSLILLVFGIYEVYSICFIKQKTGENFQIMEQPKAVDEYHCKTICADRKDCFSFTFTDYRCKLFGSKKVSSPTVKSSELVNVKKTSDADCRDEMKQPLITEGYSPNPAISYLTEIDEFEMEFNTWQACLKGWMLDIVLPGNSHRLEGDMFNHIHWDGKIGSWILTKKTEQSKSNTTVYIRAARCFLVLPELYTDTTSCGGSLPAATLGEGQVFAHPISTEYIRIDCGYATRLNTDFGDTTVVWRDQGLICIDGSWMFFLKKGGKFDDAWKILRGSCLKKIRN